MPNLASLTLSPGLALKAVLRHRRGAPADAATLPAPTLADLTQALEWKGLHPRWSQIEAEDLVHLDLPSLVQGRKGELWLLVARRRKAFCLEGPEGHREWIPKAELAAAYGGTALDLLPLLPEGSLWVRVLRLIWHHRASLYGMLCLALLSQALALASPQILGLLVDRVFPNGTTSLFHLLIFGTLLVSGFQIAIAWYQQRFMLYLGTRLDALLERGLLVHILRIPYLTLQRWPMGDLIQGVSGISTAKDLFTGDLLGSLLSGVLGGAYLILMVNLLPGPTLLVVVTSLVMAVASLALTRWQVRFQRAIVKAQSSERGYLVELLNGVATLKAAGAETRVLREWTHRLRRERYLNLHTQRVNLALSSGIGLVGQLQTEILLIWGAKQVLDGHIQLGDLLAFTMMAGAFQSSISGFSAALSNLWLIKPHLEPAERLLACTLEPEVTHPAEGPLHGPILIQDLWFRYGPEHPWIFEGLTLRIEPGEAFQIEGPSGFGKSTLLKLIAGFYTPERGTIHVGGWSPYEARSRSIYLPQFIHLFNASILENLRLFSGHVPRERLMKAAALTGLDELVASLPMGYDTLISQGGQNFSGGQRQLVALTAVLASDRPILLLDEAMANLDPLRKAGIAQSTLLRGRTVIYASHDTTFQPLEEASA